MSVRLRAIRLVDVGDTVALEDVEPTLHMLHRFENRMETVFERVCLEELGTGRGLEQ
jgi:hypothetical protein